MAAVPPDPLALTRRPLLLVGLSTFALLGVLQSFYGPLFGAMQLRFGIGVAQVGGVVSAHFVGSTFAVLLTTVLLPRLGYPRLLVAAASLMALGAATLALAPSWAMALGAAGLTGFGYGLLVVLFNVAFARAFGARGVSALNLLNAVFGVGAVAGPGLLALAIGRWDSVAVLGGSFVAMAVAAVVLAGVAVALRARLALPPVAAAKTGAAALPWGWMAGFSLLLLVYVGMETGSASWAPTHLGARMAESQAALGSAAFWLAVTAGRFLAAAVAGRVAPAQLVIGGAVLAAGGAALAHVPALALASYLLIGLGAAPVFPTVIAWVGRSFPDQAERMTPLIMTVGNLGPVVGVPAIGLAVAAWGPSAVPSALLAMALALMVLGLLLRRVSAAAG